jgi:hypothetical protein
VNPPETMAGKPELRMGEPRRLTTGALLAQSVVLFFPVPILTLMLVSATPLGLWTYLIPALVLVGTIVCVPFFQGNAFAARWARALDPAAGKGQESFIVQLTFSPRVRSGLRAALDDADDIGSLRIEPRRLVYLGDSIELELPFTHVRQAKLENIGWRGLFLYRAPVMLVVEGLPGVKEIRFVDRSALVLPGSGGICRRLLEQVRGGMERAGSNATPGAGASGR